MKNIIRICVCALTCLPLTRAVAQNVAAGAHVRVWETMSTDSPVLTIGHVTTLTADSLLLIPDGNREPLAIARAGIRRLDVSTGAHGGSRSLSAGTGALIGALGGGMLAVMVGNATRRNAAKAGFFGFGIGLVVGATIGGTHPGEGWHTLTTY